MADPIPLTDPSGAVRAWACGTCGSTHAPHPVSARLDSTIDDAARASRSAAAVCCIRCACGARALGICDDCKRVARLAFAALASIGIAVATLRYAMREWLVPSERDECVATLCGVSVETVRGWP